MPYTTLFRSQPRQKAVHEGAQNNPKRLAGQRADDQGPVVAPDQGEGDGDDHARQARHDPEDEFLAERQVLAEGDGADVVESRSEERRVGKEGVSTGRSRWSQ